MIQFEDFPENAKIWIYQSGRKLNEDEVKGTSELLQRFTKSWTSHNQALKASAAVLFNHFIVLMVDETQASTGGCSIDSSVQFIKKIGAELQTDFFNRMTFAYQLHDNIELATKPDFAQLYQEGKIDDNTIVFNNLVKTKGEFTSQWQIPLKDSWHKRFL